MVWLPTFIDALYVGWDVWGSLVTLVAVAVVMVGATIAWWEVIVGFVGEIFRMFGDE